MSEQEIYERLLDYNVLSEIEFVLQQGDEELEHLSELVGGMVGIDEDELSDMVKTVEVFVECGFLEITEDGVVSLADDLQEDAEESEQSVNVSSEEPSPPSSKPEDEIHEGDSEDTRVQDSPIVTGGTRTNLTTDVEITLDATEMDPEDLRKKLEIIRESTHDEE